MPLTDLLPSSRAPRAVGPLFALFLAAGLGGTSPARAGLMLSLPADVPATAGSSGNYFDVVLGVTGTANVSAFQFSLTLPGASGITFTSADTTSPGYIFPGSSGIGWTVGGNGLSITAGDLDADPPGYLSLSDTTVSLGRVYFRVDASAPGGTVPVAFDTAPLQTLLLDDSLNALDYATQPGSIAVTATAVPEPATFRLVVAGALFVGGYGRLRRGISWGRCRVG